MTNQCSAVKHRTGATDSHGDTPCNTTTDETTKLLAEAGTEEQVDTAAVAKDASMEEASLKDGEASSGRGKRVQRSRRPTLAVLEASTGELSDTDVAGQPEPPEETAADEGDLQDYHPEGMMTAAPTSAPPSAKRKRSRARQPSATEAEAGLPEAGIGEGATTPPEVLFEQPEDQPDAEAAMEPPQPDPLPAKAPPSAKGQRTRARQPPAKFQPTFSPDRPAAKRAPKPAAPVLAADPPAAAGPPGGSSRARRGRGSAAQHAVQALLDDAGATGDMAAPHGNSAPANAAIGSVAADAAGHGTAAIHGVPKQGGRSKPGSDATAASSRQAHPTRSCPGLSTESGSLQGHPR